MWSQRIGPDQGVPLNQITTFRAPPRARADVALASAPRDTGGEMADDTKILLTESEIPTHWVNLMPDLPGEPAPPLRPDGAPAGPDDLSPIFPMGLIAAGGLGRAGDRDPRRGARDLQAVAPDAAVPGAPPRARARYPGAHLLQVRGHLAGRARTSPTPPCRRPTTTARRACAGSRPRPAPGSGARRSPSPAG